MTLPMQGPAAQDTPRPQGSLDRVRDALARRGDPMRGRHLDFMAQCPIHDDDKASLHVTYTPGDDGRVLLTCFGCHGDPRDIAAGLGLTMGDLFDRPLPPRTDRAGRSTTRRRTGKRWGRIGPLPARITSPKAPHEAEEKLSWKVIEEYDYARPDGEVVQQVIRKEATTSAGERRKTFTQAYFTPSGRVTKKPEGFEPTWYRAPELVDAMVDGETVWICEGEKDVHAAEAAGVVAATNAGGAGSLSDAMIDLLEGGTIRVVLDRDEAGYRRGIHLLEALEEHADIQAFLPRTPESKSDLSDHLAAGHRLDDLIPVSLNELRAWAEASRIESQVSLLEVADQEARAHLEEAQRREEDAPKTAETHRKRATRWAIEAEVRYDQVSETATNTERYASVSQSAWAREAAGWTRDMQQQAADRTRELLALAGRDIPPSLQQGAEVPAVLPPASEPEDAQPAAPLEAAPNLPAGEAIAPVGETDTSTEISAPKYVLVNGQICREEWKPLRDSESSYVRHLKLILGLDARVIARDSREKIHRDDFVDMLRTHEEPAPEPEGEDQKPVEVTRVKTDGIKQVMIAYTHPLSKEQIVTAVAADDYQSGRWLERLDFAVDYLSTNNGRAEVYRAIQQISQSASRTVYQYTGWRRRTTAAGDTEWVYVHAGGIITPHGLRSAPVEMTGCLERVRLPRPTHAGDELRSAFEGTVGQLLEQCPRRLILPLVGFMMRSILGHNPSIAILVGVPGTMKSSLSSWLMSFFGETWRRNEPSMSLAGTGDTTNAARIGMARAKDCVWWADDAAPDRGFAYAQRAIKETARMISERVIRGRSTRDGADVTLGERPNCSGLFTSELAPEAGSGQQRTFPFPLRAGDIPLDLMKHQGTAIPRYQRTLLTSSFIQWLAQHDPQMLRETTDLESDAYVHELTASYLRGGQADVRPGAAISQMWAGAKLFFEFLVDAGAFTEDEGAAWMAELNESLFEAWQATVDPDIPVSTGGRVREMLQYALHSGIAYLSDTETGTAPSRTLAPRLGWKSAGSGDFERMEARGIHLGWINTSSATGTPEIYLEPNALTHVLSQVKSATDAVIELDRATATRSLYDEGMLETDAPQPGKAPKMTKSRLLAYMNTRKRVLVIPFPAMFPEDDEGENPRLVGTSAPQGPTPLTRRGPITPIAPALQPAAAATTPPTAPAPIPVAPPAAQTIGAVALAPTSAPAPSPVPVAVPAPAAAPAQQPAPAPQVEERPLRVLPAAQTAPERPIGPAAVLDVDAIHTPDGKRHAWPEIRHVGDLAELAPALGIRHQQGDLTETGQLWITHAAALKLGLPVDQLGDDPMKTRTKLRELTTGHEMITRAQHAGYRVGGQGSSLSNWTRVFREQDREPLAMLVLMSALPADFPLIDDQPPADELVERLQETATHIGMPLLMHPGQTGLDLAVKLRRKTKGGVKRLFEPFEPVEPARASNTERDLSWSRIPSDHEKKHRYLHAYDRGGSYAAGAASLELGIGAPVHHPDGTRFEKNLPGYWRITVPPSDDWRFPHPLAPGGQKIPERDVWVTTPTLEFALGDLGYDVEIHEAYTWPEHTRILDPWYKQIREGRSQLLEKIQRLSHPTDEAGVIDLTNAEHALDALKAVYTRTIGMMGSHEWMAGKQGYAPDRRHHIIAKSRANILRRVVAIGREHGAWPIAIATDTICYLSDNPDPTAAWPGTPDQLGRGFGQYKHEGSALLTGHLEHLTGHGWLGKDHLTDPADWNPQES